MSVRLAFELHLDTTSDWAAHGAPQAGLMALFSHRKLFLLSSYLACFALTVFHCDLSVYLCPQLHCQLLEENNQGFPCQMNKEYDRIKGKRP